MRLLTVAVVGGTLAGCLDFSDADPTERPTEALPASCKVIKEADVTAVDGVYEIDPDGQGARASRSVYCDMKRDGGGWTLMRAQDVTLRQPLQVTLVESEGPNGGVELKATPLTAACDGDPRGQLEVRFDPGFSWTHIRARHVFSGEANCWSLFGDSEYAPDLSPNIAPFDPAVDTIRDAIRMGGSLGDGYYGGADFPGDNTRCDETAENFWEGQHGHAPRTAVVILRRLDLNAPAGLGTGVGCVLVHPETYWELREIYVR